jgi:hypothetical protein
MANPGKTVGKTLWGWPAIHDSLDNDQGHVSVEHMFWAVHPKIAVPTIHGLLADTIDIFTKESHIGFVIEDVAGSR